ncbi:hypothetical protein EDC01DRAFT_626815 [Geopyxis carbonaria]|nr:hypothetical protein EDC01DRAFT_626815 [Geopyxis carbonaria]
MAPPKFLPRFLVTNGVGDKRYTNPKLKLHPMYCETFMIFAGVFTFAYQLPLAISNTSWAVWAKLRLGLVYYVVYTVFGMLTWLGTWAFAITRATWTSYCSADSRYHGGDDISEYEDNVYLDCGVQWVDLVVTTIYAGVSVAMLVFAGKAHRAMKRNKHKAAVEGLGIELRSEIEVLQKEVFKLQGQVARTT